MRTQWCREHIDQTAEECGLGDDVVSDVKRAADFCETHPDLSGCSTRAIMALIRVKDEKVRDLAIRHVENRLNDLLPTGGKKVKSLTEPEIRKIISQAEKELGKEPRTVKPAKKTPPPVRCMYLSRDETRCNAPEEYQQKCTEGRREEKNCPIPYVELPEPRRLSDTLTGKENNTRSVLPTSGYPTPATRYTVEANRHDVVTIQNMIKYGDANDEEEAVQTIFEDGVALWLDKIERHIEEEATRGEEEECSA